MKRFFSLLLSLMTFFMTACSSSIQKADSIYEETTKETSTTIAEKSTTEANTVVITKETESSTEVITTSECTTIKNVNTTKPLTTENKTISSAIPSYYPEEEMLALYNSVNNYRAEKGLNKLSLDLELCKLAYIRAKEQEISKGHTRPNGLRFFTLLDECNYSYITSGENIVLIWENPSTRPLELWKSSKTHNENMLKTKWTKTGIAMYQNSDGRYNIVQLFAH